MTTNGSVPILGRDLSVRLPKHQYGILRAWAQQRGVDPSQAAGLILGERLDMMAQAFAVELAVRASLIA